MIAVGTGVRYDVQPRSFRALLRFLPAAAFASALAAALAASGCRAAPRYEVSSFPLPAEARGSPTLLAGAAVSDITPPRGMWEPWSDADGNARFEPRQGDTFTDLDGDGRFDALYLAGFHGNRAVSGVHDPLSARALVLDDGSTAVALVVLDAIGFFRHEVERVRALLRKERPGLDAVLVASTHCHEVPDLMGLWGPSHLRSGVSEAYLDLVRSRTVEAIVAAYDARRPARAATMEVPIEARDLQSDTRPPEVLDRTLRLLKLTERDSGLSICTLMNWGNHPESLGSGNTLISADFTGYAVEAVEHGISREGTLLRPGAGGVAIFATGAVGGLMTPLRVAVEDPWSGESYRSASFEKARAIGQRIASLALDGLERDDWREEEAPAVAWTSVRFRLPVKNGLLLLGTFLGVIRRPFEGFATMTSEVGLLSLGAIRLLALPCEVYPEMVWGGMEAPAGADYPGAGAPVETPPLAELVGGSAFFLLGLCDDEVGYVMPRTQWDARPPYTYGAAEAHYGEENSPGPEAGPSLHAAVRRLVERSAAE